MPKKRKRGLAPQKPETSLPKEVQSKHGVSKSVIVLACGLVVAATIIGAAILIVHDRQVQNSNRLFVENQQVTAESVITSVRETLDSKNAGAAKVYDADGNQLFTIRNTQGLTPVDNVPSELRDALLKVAVGDSGARKIDLDAWSKDSNSDASKLTAGSLGWEAVNCWTSYTNNDLSDDVKIVVASALETSFSADELFNYVMAASMFGGNRGLVIASEAWFGKQPSQLNNWQRGFMIYAFKNIAADWEDYQSSNPDNLGGATSAEEFGFVGEGGGTYWLIRKYVQNELATVLKTTELKKDYNVRLKINPRLQGDLQSAVDNGMASSVTLNSTGQTVMDGTAMAVDSRTGYVVACVGGRSQNTMGNELVFQEQSNVGIFEAVGEMLDKDKALTYASLVSYDTLSGKKEVSTLGAMAMQGQLSQLGVSPVVQPKIELSEIANFLSGLYVNCGPRFIEQVQESDGRSVFTAEAAVDVSQQGTNADIRCLLANSTDATGVDYVQYAKAGAAVATATSEFIVAGLYGANAQGYSMSESDMNMCVGTAVSVVDTVAKYFPAEPKTVDPAGTVKAKVEKAQVSNAEYVEELVNTWVNELKAMPITSASEGTEFANAFAYYSSVVSNYHGVISDDLVHSLGEKISAVRVARSDELLKYAS